MPTNRLLVKEEIATYAATLLDAAGAEGGQERVIAVRDQLNQVLFAFRENGRIRENLSNSSLSAQQRYELAASVFEGCDPLAVSVLAVMAERGNLGELSAVIDAFVNAAENKLNVSIVDVVTAVALDDELRGIITEKLSKDLGKPVVLCETVDKSILGGIIMSTNGKRIDASISSKLEGTRALLKENNDGGEC